VALWDALIESGGPYGITPAGLLALDIARVEAGLILIDVDYVPAHRAVIGLRKSSPFELGLGWAVRLEKTGFVGHAALRDEAARPSGWELHGIEVDWDSLEAAYATVALPPQLPWITVRESVPVYVEDYQIGYATSRCWSPTLKKYVGLAHLEASSVNEGDEVEIEITVEHRRRRALARVAKTPFFDPPRKRATPAPAGARG
jgi:aminomethyltransferase